MFKNIFLTDSKREITPQIARALRELDIPLRAMNPDGGLEDQGCISTNFNVYEPIIDAYYSDDPAIYQKSTQFLRHTARIQTPEPDKGVNNPFFDINGALAGQLFVAHEVVHNPENATPARIYEIASNGELATEIIKSAASYKSPVANDPFVDDMRREAGSFHQLITENPKYASQFYQKPKSALQAFDQTGALSNYGEYATARISDIRKQRCFLSCMVPLISLEDYKVFMSLTTYAVMASCMIDTSDRNFPIRMILEEFIAMRIPDFDKYMNVLRGLGITAEIYVQNRQGVVKNYDELSEGQIFANCDLKQFTNIDDPDLAEYIQKLAGKRVYKSFSHSMQGAANDSSIGINDIEEPALSIPQIKAQPLDQQFIKARGVPLFSAYKLPYWCIEGLREKIDASPHEGEPPKVPARVKLKITKDGFTLISPRPAPGTHDAHINRSRWHTASPITWKSFLWLYAWIAIGVFVQLYWGWSIWPF